ncbi:MAG TPA: PEP-CTERM sorting domain-containing protein [Luteolibacter sp.]|nr:PEP-CTERM sorting domain-containing protein [Luteolibacter sp.]
MSVVSSSPLRAAAAAIVAFPSFAGAALVSIDFETAGDFANNFRATYDPTETTTSQGSGYLSTNATALNSGTTVSETYIYDTTPESSAVQSTFSGPVTISFDLRAAQTNASFGIYIVNTAETAGTAGHRLALFNLTSGATDRIRFFSTSSITNANVGTMVHDSTATLSVTEPGAGFVNASLVYSQGANSSAIFNYTINGVSTGDINLGNNTYIPNFEIGIRLYDASVGGGTSDIDNFQVIPEPASLALIGLASAGFFVRRRR